MTVELHTHTLSLSLLEPLPEKDMYFVK